MQRRCKIQDDERAVSRGIARLVFVVCAGMIGHGYGDVGAS